MSTSSSTSSKPPVFSSASRPKPALQGQPTAEQQHLLDRIALQRERIHARRVARAQSQAVALNTEPAMGGVDESFALRAAGFAREHPLAVLGVVGIAAVAGPRRLIRWAGVLLPMLMRLRR